LHQTHKDFFNVKTVAALFISLCAFFVKGQTGLPQIEPIVSLAVPINEFAEADTTERAFFGLGAEVTFPFLYDTPLRVGASFRYYWMGSTSKTVDVRGTSGNDIELTSKVRGGMTPLHLHLRLDPMNYTDFPVLPYIGGFAGIRFFGTNNRVSIDYLDGSEPEIEHNRKVDVTSSYGFEVGLHIRLSYYLSLDFRYERAYGGWAQYLDFGSIEIDSQGNASYQLLETRTDVEMFTIGLAVELD